MLPKLWAILAGACFSGAFVLEDPYWFLAACLAVLFISILRGGLSG